GDQRCDLALPLVERTGVEQRRLGDPLAKNPQAIALLAQTLDLVLAAVKLRVARMVAVEAAGIDLDRAGPAAGTAALDGFARRLVHGEEIIAIDLDGRHAEAGGSAGDV